MKKKHGFTLVEIVITTSIISLLVGLASYTILRGLEKAKINRAQGELGMLSTSILKLAWDTGQWPNEKSRATTAGRMVTDLSSSRCGLWEYSRRFDHWNGPYYEGTTVDPWNHNYYFKPDFSSNGVAHAVVASPGPDGIIGGDDDIAVLLDD